MLTLHQLHRSVAHVLAVHLLDGFCEVGRVCLASGATEEEEKKKSRLRFKKEQDKRQEAEGQTGARDETGAASKGAR